MSRWYEKGWIGHNIVKPVIDYVKDYGIGIRYTANGDGTNGQISGNIGPIGYRTNNEFYYAPRPIQRTNYGIKQNSAAYSRTSARTAKDIAQGGMTKDEIQDFNNRHPNETANIGG